MKDLGDVKKILGMEITRDRERGILIVFQEDYVWKVLGNFSMEKFKSVLILLGVYFRLSLAIEKELKDQEFYMRDVFYQSVVGLLMYSMVGIRFDLVYVIGMVCRFMSSFIKIYW